MLKVSFCDQSMSVMCRQQFPLNDKPSYAMYTTGSILHHRTVP